MKKKKRKSKKSNPVNQDMILSSGSIVSLSLILYSIYKVGSIVTKKFSTVSMGVRG